MNPAGERGVTKSPSLRFDPFLHSVVKASFSNSILRVPTIEAVSPFLARWPTELEIFPSPLRPSSPAGEPPHGSSFPPEL